jgi:hypothetical protein
MTNTHAERFLVKAKQDSLPRFIILQAGGHVHKRTIVPARAHHARNAKSVSRHAEQQRNLCPECRAMGAERSRRARDLFFLSKERKPANIFLRSPNDSRMYYPKMHCEGGEEFMSLFLRSPAQELHKAGRHRGLKVDPSFPATHSIFPSSRRCERACLRLIHQWCHVHPSVTQRHGH